MVKKLVRVLLSIIKQFFKRLYQIIVFFGVYGLLATAFIVPLGLVIYPLIWLFIVLIVWLKHLELQRWAKGNIILFGSRGGGKTTLFDYLISKEEAPLCNVPIQHAEVVDPGIYYSSISPNTALEYLRGNVTKVDKNWNFEGRPYYLDDGALYLPNYLDYELKRLFPSMGLQVPINRHLYGTYNVINTQDLDRTYKLVRELQTDGYIKALKVVGKSWFWNQIPILKKYLIVKYRYYQNYNSASQGLLPFSKLGITNELGKSIYTTNASALKEQYIATNGIIFDGFIIRKKSKMKFNTRYYHDVFFEETNIKIDEYELFDLLQFTSQK